MKELIKDVCETLKSAGFEVSYNLRDQSAAASFKIKHVSFIYCPVVKRDFLTKEGVLCVAAGDGFDRKTSSEVIEHAMSILNACLKAKDFKETVSEPEF